MERRSSSDSERTISDNERVGSSERSEQKRKWEEGTPSTGFGSGPAGKRHLRFTGTATIHFDFNIQTESLSKESAQQQQETPPEKAHDQASSRKPCREVRLFGVNIADSLGRQQQETSSSRQQFGWQEQEAFHLAQPHQETRPLSQQGVLNEQMPLDISSDSDSEPRNARPLSIRETSHEKIHHQISNDRITLSTSHPHRTEKDLEAIAQAYLDIQSHQKLPDEMREKINAQPFTKPEFDYIITIFKKRENNLSNKDFLRLWQIAYGKSKKGREVSNRYNKGDGAKAASKRFYQKQKQKEKSFGKNPEPTWKDLK